MTRKLTSWFTKTLEILEDATLKVADSVIDAMNAAFESLADNYLPTSSDQSPRTKSANAPHENSTGSGVPGYLDLIVDYESQTIRWVGYENVKVVLSRTVLWRIFVKLFIRARHTDEQRCPTQ